MNCSDIRDLLDEYVDEELSSQQRDLVDRHISECPSCRAELETTEHTAGLVRSLPRESVPDGLAEAVQEQVRLADQRKRRAVALRWVGVGGWLAAAAALALVLRYGWFPPEPGRPPAETEIVITREEPPEKPLDEAAPPAPEEPVVAEREREREPAFPAEEKDVALPSELNALSEGPVRDIVAERERQVIEVTAVRLGRRLAVEDGTLTVMGVDRETTYAAVRQALDFVAEENILDERRDGEPDGEVTAILVTLPRAKLDEFRSRMAQLGHDDRERAPGVAPESAERALRRETLEMETPVTEKSDDADAIKLPDEVDAAEDAEMVTVRIELDIVGPDRVMRGNDVPAVQYRLQDIDAPEDDAD